nr:neurogenic locus notch homolog protein 1-like [Paramormyrops kingsleyae]
MHRFFVKLTLFLSSIALTRGIRCALPAESCLNGGRCEASRDGDGECKCPDDFVGNRCQLLNPCATNKCANGGTCGVDVRGNTAVSKCSCPPGFMDDVCLTPTNHVCMNNPCKNGGTCDLLSVNEHRCRCPPGWSGKTCSQADPCASNPCANGGQCSPFESHYICTCTPTFHGQTCKVDVNECAQSPSPCKNGGTCVNEVGSYRCECPREYTGKHCEVLYRPCSPSPCLNGGTCMQRGNTTYECTCLPGFSGQHCEQNIDDCVDHRCQNGGACVDGVNTYNCQCRPHWTGQFCTEDVDECQMMPNLCQNGGTCHNTHGGYHCVCVNGWMGDDCSENINDCANAACHNGATCHDRVASFFCECPHGRTGLLCHLDDACISNPCQKGSNCDTNPVNGKAICTCPPGYTGSACNQDIDECFLGANPCEHGGSCMNTMGSFQCSCHEGFSGPRCEIDINECMSNPCKNDATCLDRIGGFHCICMPGYSGPSCEVNVDECASSPCLNNGKCVDRINAFHCECPAGFSGQHCEQNIDDCVDHRCQNGGACVDGVNTYNCQCRPHWTGQFCTEDVDECQMMPNLCQNGGPCHNTHGGYHCVCVNGWMGDDCSENINDCANAACHNGATCHDRVASFFCECPHGRTGLLCHLDDACISNPCQKGSNCDTNPVNGKAICTCPPGYTGSACNQDIDECFLGANPCEHGGSCMNTMGSFQCSCHEGFSGPRCEIDINECMSNPCKNDATCLDRIGGFHCICMPGYSGPSCEVNVDECASSPCLNNGKCVDRINAFHCECPAGFTGNLCQRDIDECASTPCQNGAKCVDGPNKYTCECTEGYMGTHCETDVDECASNPCHYGTCVDGLATFDCLCIPGYTGRLCQTNINECQSQPCQNGGTCMDRENHYFCACPKGTTGPNCEINLDDCQSKPCDYGKCIDKIDSYECACEPGYTGTMCNINIDECTSNPCHNGGICKDGINNFTCICPEGYHDATCLSQVNECDSDPCIHGHCEDKVNGYTCICDPGWSGLNCDINNNECESNPCMNGGTCKDMTSGYVCTCQAGFSACDPRGTYSCVQLANSYRCECRTGYKGQRCDKVFDGCKGRPCRNGGTCAVASNTPNGFICKCPPGYTGSTCEYDARSCGSLHCRNGGTCISGQKSPRCLCPVAYTGPECQYPVDSPCNSGPCYNGGTCQYTAEAPHFRCVCPANFNGLLCHILDYTFRGGPGSDITPAPEVPESCKVAQCEGRQGNKVCDGLCNNHACSWDGGDCSLNFDDPWKNCSAALQCWRYFNDSKCDKQCDNAGCLYDGFDCQDQEGQCNPLYDQYCKDHYADGHCDQGCNNGECEWDGLDCASDLPERLAVGHLVLVVHIPPEQLKSNLSTFLRELSRVIHTNVVFRRDANGQPMIYPYYGSEQELRKHRIKRSADPAGWAQLPGDILDRVQASVYAGLDVRRRRELDPTQVKGSVVYLEIDNRQCIQQSKDCFESATDVAAFLGALASSGNLNVPYYIEAVSSENDSQPPSELYPIYLALAALALLAVAAAGVVASRKRRREHGQLWFPEGFKVGEPGKKKRREPVGEDSVGLKPLKNSSDMSLMDDNQNEWGEVEPSSIKRFRFEEQAILDQDDQMDHRQWTQQHLDAADLRISSMAPTPPQGEIDNDCMDVNVRGPDGFTPLMIASCSGGGLETANSEEDEDASASVISDFIYQGANLHNQTDRTGETALHLAARYARSDAAKRLLESSADANVQDNMGRTPLHAAVAADAQGVFQILIRNRATDLDARMHDGTTPLILAARLAVEGMVEELINCHADANAVDDFGKSALHWAAAVNNLDAAMVLLKNGANKDMQNNKEETPLFLAAREGSYETAKVLLDHFANREITDHMDRLPRDIAQERMHHDIVRLLDEYNLVRSPTVHNGHMGATLSPPLCSPGSYLIGGKTPIQGKKVRKPGAKAVSCKDGKDLKGRRKKADCKGGLLDSSAALSPVDSLESPHGYLSDVSSPAMMASPFQPSPSVPLSHMQGIPEAHMAVGHLALAPKQDLGRAAFDPVPMRLSHLPTPSPSTSGPMGLPMGSGGTVGADWVSCPHPGTAQQGQFNPMRNATSQVALHQASPTMQHGMMVPLHIAPTLSQMMSYQGVPGGAHLATQPHLMQQLQHQQSVQQPPSIQLQHQNSSTATLNQNFISGELNQSDLQPGLVGTMSMHTILPQETQIIPSSLNQAVPSTQFLTPPSQHSYSAPMDNTPNHQLQVPDHPFLTPSPGSPDQWSSSSPHSNMSDWSEGISSPPTSMQPQIGHIPDQFK